MSSVQLERKFLLAYYMYCTVLEVDDTKTKIGFASKELHFVMGKIYT